MELIAVILLMLTALGSLKLLQALDKRSEARPKSAPIPWIRDPVWTALVRPDHASPFQLRNLADNPRETIRNPQLLEVTPGDLQRISGPAAPCAAPLEQSRLSALRRALLSTRGPFALRSPVWPICCATLSTLVHSQGKGVSLSALENQTGPLDQAFLEKELQGWGGPNADLEATFRRGWGGVLEEIRTGLHSGAGINLFRCGTCQRHYVASCSP